MCHERRSESHNTLRGAAAAAAADLHFSMRLEFGVCVAEELKTRNSPKLKKKANQGNVERVEQIAAPPPLRDHVFDIRDLGL